MAPIERTELLDVGVVDELAIRRYIEGKKRWDEKYARTYETIRKHRVKNLDMAKTETVRNVQQLQMHFIQDGNGHVNGYDKSTKSAHARGSSTPRLSDGLRKTAASWAWAWAIDDSERPPPSSIVARRDTEEARRLSKIADQPTTEDEQRLSGNKLWTYFINSLGAEKNGTGSPRMNSDGAASPREQAESITSTPSMKRKSLRRLFSVSPPVPKRVQSSPPHLEGQKIAQNAV